MANTTNYSFVKPTIGGSTDQWGANLNANWDSIDALLGGTDAAEFSILNGATVTTSELNVLDGLLPSTAELNFVGGVTSAIQAQIDTKSPTADPTFTGTATIPTANVTTANVTTANVTTANVTTVDFGGWAITEVSGVLHISTGGTVKMKLDASGNLTVVGNVTAYGTI